jgi:hypothetical protein
MNNMNRQSISFKPLFAAALFLFVFQSAQAQFISFGLKGGLNTQVNKPDDLSIPQLDTFLNFGVDKLRMGAQFGAYVRIGNKVFIQPELLFNSNRTDFKTEDINFNQLVRQEKYQYLDMPLLVGFKIGGVRFQGGPVGHIFINSKSELKDLEGYEAKFKQMTWGYQAGLNIKLLTRLSLDIRYEGNFDKFGSHINFYGNTYQFSTTPNRLIVGVNLAIKK